MFNEQNSAEEPIPPAPFLAGQRGDGRSYLVNKSVSHRLFWNKTV